MDRGDQRRVMLSILTISMGLRRSSKEPTCLFYFFISFILRFASVNSSAGVFCVFLINPCSTISVSSRKQSISLAILWLGKEERGARLQRRGMTTALFIRPAPIGS
jgi:hypothetical protein